QRDRACIDLRSFPTRRSSDLTYGGMLNIGFRPTVAGGDPERHIEAHIFNFSQDIYAKEVTLYCLEKMREEHRFPSIEALKEQLEADKVEALKILKQAKY